MANSIEVTRDELRLAWRRYKFDRPDRCFVVHPYVTEWLDDLNRDAWLERIQQRIEKGFEPASGRVCFVPKPGHLLRAATVLSPEDEVVYNFLVGRLLPQIHLELYPLQARKGGSDFGYQLQPSPSTPRWTRKQIESWHHLRRFSVERLATFPFVVVADIAGFYDNIDLDRLIWELRDVCGAQPEITLLRICLQKWAAPRNKGIPQGHSASDILAKLYLRTLDRDLIDQGFIHSRWVDDIRIFVESQLKGKQALRRLVELLHRIGLTAQSAKSDILLRSQARAKFEGVTPVIEQLRKELMVEVEAESQDAGP